MNDIGPFSSPGTTLYKDVKRQMLQALSAGEWSAGAAIPAEKKLCDRFGVSIGTLRKAIDELVAENILVRHQGRGTFVTLHNRGQNLFRFFNVVGQDGQKIYPDIMLLKFAKAKADKTACVKLALPNGAKAFRFTNILSLRGEPTVIDEITLPEALFPGLTETQLRDRPNTLYNLYQVSFGLNVIRTDERIRATLASAEQAKLLGVEPGAPLLEIHRIAFSYNDQPVEWRMSYINTERHEYFVAPTL